MSALYISNSALILQFVQVITINKVNALSATIMKPSRCRAEFDTGYSVIDH